MKSFKNVLLLIAIAAILTIGSVLGRFAIAAEMLPIKIGLQYSLTGPQAAYGIFQMHAAKMFFEEKGLQVAGRKIELISEDDEHKVDVGLMKTKKLVDMDKVNIIQGYLLTPLGYAVRDYLHERKIPTLLNCPGAKHSRALFSPYLFRVAASGYQFSYEPAKWWYQHGYKKVVWVGSNFEAPREMYDAFKRGFEEAGGKIIQDLWPAFGSTDFAPYLTAVKAREADAMVVAVWGVDAVRLVNQWVESGLKKRIRIIGVGSFTNEGITLSSMGLNAEGVLSFFISCPQADNPENRKFVEGFKRRTGHLPDHFAYYSYISAEATYRALEKVKGNVEDKEKFLDALNRIEFRTPMGGKAYFDDKHAMVYDVIFLEARKTNSECHLFEIGRVKDVKDPYHMFP